MCRPHFTWVVALAATCLASAALAANDGAAPPGGSQAFVVNSVAAPLRRLNTYVSTGNGNGSLLTGGGVGPNIIESRTVNCPNVAGCYVGQESMVQITVGEVWSICLYVDDVVTGCSNHDLRDPGTNGFVVGNARGMSALLRQGVHSVKTVVEIPFFGGTLYQWQTDHRVYKP
jgi:hypothetical protein